VNYDQWFISLLFTKNKWVGALKYSLVYTGYTASRTDEMLLLQHGKIWKYKSEHILGGTGSSILRRVDDHEYCLIYRNHAANKIKKLALAAVCRFLLVDDDLYDIICIIYYFHILPYHIMYMYIYSVIR